MPPQDPAPEIAGEAAGRGAGAPASTVIRLEGPDALDLLHRVSTQALADLEPGHARIALFCDFRGRLLHRVAVAAGGDRAVWLLRPDAPAEELLAYLDRHVFRDQVRIAAAPGGWMVRAVRGSGPAAGTSIERASRPERVQLAPDLAWVVGPPGEVTAIPEAESEAERIAAGRPRHGHEVHPDFTPYEVGLAHEVHLDKGCFTGQEALLRLVTYGGVRRRLARVAGAGAPPGVPRDLTLAGETVGRLTSAAAGAGGWIGLAVVRAAALEAAARLELEGHGAIDPPLAFPESRPLGLP
jgi:folate-binding protein YgfZ